MAVVLNEVAIQKFFHSPDSPVARIVFRQAERVERRARQNASGQFINIVTGDLLANLRISPVERVEGLGFAVGSDSRHKGVLYPPIVTRQEDAFPGGWLLEALEAEIFYGAN